MGRIENGEDTEQMLGAIYRHALHAHKAMGAFTSLYVKPSVKLISGFHTRERGQKTHRIGVTQYRRNGCQPTYINLLHSCSADSQCGSALAGRQYGAVELICNRIGLPPGFHESQKAEKHKGRP